MNAVSLDGFIARADGKTDWVDDFEEWEAAARHTGAIIVGRKTFDEIKGDGLWDEVTYFVLTGQLDEPQEANVVACWSPEEAITNVENYGFTKVLLCGGAESNGEFARLNLIDDVVLNLHPVLLGTGKRLLGDYEKELQLEATHYSDHQKFIKITAHVHKHLLNYDKHP